MRVLHVGKFWPPYPGGIESASRELCAALVAEGVEVDVLAHGSPPSWRVRTLEDQGIAVHLAACPAQLAYAPLSPGFPLLLGRLIRERRPEILHLHLPNPSAFWVLAVATARRLPLVLHWHADVPLAEVPRAVRLFYGLYRHPEQALLRRAARIICTSPDYRDGSPVLAPWLDKTRVIPLGVAPVPAPAASEREAAAALWRGSGLRVLAVGRLSHYKGFDVLIEALAEVPEARLLLVGAGECGAALQRQVRERGLEGRVHLAGALSDALRDGAYAAADVFCLPSIARSEAFGVVLLEAMRAGLPVIATRVPGAGMNHVLDGGEAGVLVPPGDVAALAAALRELAADPARRQRFANAGHARWRDAFTLARSARAVRDLYAELASSS